MKVCEMRRVVMFACCCLAVAGCKTAPYKSSKIPPLQMGSPLKSVPPRTFIVKEFKDIRGVNPNAYCLSASMDRPIASIVRTAICNELERNAHVCEAEAGPKAADFVIEGTVYKFWLNVYQPFIGPNKVTANVGVKLTLLGSGSNQTLLVRTYEGSATRKVVEPRGYGPLMTQGLMNMLEELTYDQQLVDSIKK